MVGSPFWLGLWWSFWSRFPVVGSPFWLGRWGFLVAISVVVVVVQYWLGRCGAVVGSGGGGRGGAVVVGCGDGWLWLKTTKTCFGNFCQVITENTQNDNFDVLCFLCKFSTHFQKRVFENRIENAFSLF